jgi:hypothetical protein
VDLAVTVALGGDCAADIALLRAQPGVFGVVASDPTVSRVIDDLAEAGDGALTAIRAARVWIGWNGMHVVSIGTQYEMRGRSIQDTDRACRGLVALFVGTVAFEYVPRLPQRGEDTVGQALRVDV